MGGESKLKHTCCFFRLGGNPKNMFFSDFRRPRASRPAAEAPEGMDAAAAEKQILHGGSFLICIHNYICYQKTLKDPMDLKGSFLVLSYVVLNFRMIFDSSDHCGSATTFLLGIGIFTT